MSKALNPIFKVLLCICALSVGGCAADLHAGAQAAKRRGDYSTEAMLRRSLAARGDAVAQIGLGAMYDAGRGVTQDYKEAARLYGLAAAQGNALGLGFLGAMYEKGKGVTQDYKEAARLYGLAAAQGDAIGHISLGLMYYEGKGVTQDYKEAARLYGLAAAQGEVLGQNLLGEMYEKGKGVTQDYKEAARLYGLAAAQGDAEGRAKVVAIETAFATQAAEALAKTRELDAEAEAQAPEKDDAECKSFGAVVGSPAYVQCRISLKALRQGVLENQQKAAQDNSRAGELKAQSEQQQRLAQQRADREAELQRQAAAQQQAIFEKERSDRQAMALLGLSAALLQGGAASRPPPPPSGMHTYIMNGRTVTCTTTANFTNCF